jgi:hypothetical protein
VATSKRATKRQAARPTAQVKQEDVKAAKPAPAKVSKTAKVAASATVSRPVTPAKPVHPPKSAPVRAETRMAAAPARKATTTPASKAAAKTPRTPAKRRPAQAKVASRGRTKGAKGARGAAPKPAVPVVRLVKVKELDPITKCGPGTSVEQLFRVDEELGGHATVHLVFFDKHGWYCVHGPRCAAVADVHSHTRSQQRARAVGR